ncbi:MAG: dTDP-4-amino-4,6-dideoxygalactose transaminase [Pseudomonadales bacterium]|nr:dTDP-4-amino-4,6-dideoxygalactose transaminase [Pseudomonadales bacterium]
MLSDSTGKFRIPFNKPHLTGREAHYIYEAYQLGGLAGDGTFTKSCHEWLVSNFALHAALLTHSCTAALEMMAILVDIKPGDEVILPSYTFVSTANAFVLRGAVPVFVDIRPDTLNMDENRIEAAITRKTRAIVPVHYAGVACEMDTIANIAKQHDLYVLEDAAQGVMSAYKGRALGSIGHLGAYSFHETKNVISGEGGALTINDPAFLKRAEIIREKGTNRSEFFRGEVDKYSWVDIGSSYLPGELIAAFLKAQLEAAESITHKRLACWNRYHEKMALLEQQGLIQRPTIPPHCQHNGHMYYILLQDFETRTALMGFLRERGIYAVFHYVPLHSSPAGQKFGRASGKLEFTSGLADRLLRLPLYCDLTSEEIDTVINACYDFFTQKGVRH